MDEMTAHKARPHRRFIILEPATPSMDIDPAARRRIIARQIRDQSGADV